MEAQAISQLRSRSNFKSIDVPPTPEFLNDQQRIHLATQLAEKGVKLQNLPQMYQYVRWYVNKVCNG